MRMKAIVGLLIFSLSALMVVVSPAFAQVMELKDGVERLAAELAKSVPTGRTLRVAVTDFPDLQGVTSNLGRYVAERLTTRLSTQTEKFRIIERRRLGQVLGELKFSMSDLVDPSKAKELGRMLGVEAIVVGTVSDLGNSVDIDARIIEIETNNILPGMTVAISKDETVRRMWDEGRSSDTASPRPAPTAGGAPPSRTQQQKATAAVETERFKLELVSTEIAGNVVRFTFFFTNLLDQQRYISLADSRSYMIDDLGNRYELVNGSDGVQPPNLRTKVWVSFKPPDSRASQVHIFLAGLGWPPVALRDIPLPR